jgi:cell division protein FtsL
VEREFVVRKQVQNRAIVREVDHARQRDLVRTVVGGACVLVTVLFAAWQHLDARRLDKVEAGLTRQQARLRAVYRHLVLEQEFLVGPARVEAIATRQLGMKPPTHETSTVIERVTVTPPPTSAEVAQR